MDKQLVKEAETHKERRDSPISYNSDREKVKCEDRALTKTCTKRQK